MPAHTAAPPGPDGILGKSSAGYLYFGPGNNASSPVWACDGQQLTQMLPATFCTSWASLSNGRFLVATHYEGTKNLYAFEGTQVFSLASGIAPYNLFTQGVNVYFLENEALWYSARSSLFHTSRSIYHSNSSLLHSRPG
jgi:hypothetical protein